MQKDFPKSALHCQKHMSAYSSNGNQKEGEEREQKYQAV
jgi:hypothetical protein